MRAMKGNDITLELRRLLLLTLWARVLRLQQSLIRRNALAVHFAAIIQ
jgi:hypothetical protein